MGWGRSGLDQATLGGIRGGTATVSLHHHHHHHGDTQGGNRLLESCRRWVRCCFLCRQGAWGWDLPTAAATGESSGKPGACRALRRASQSGANRARPINYLLGDKVHGFVLPPPWKKKNKKQKCKLGSLVRWRDVSLEPYTSLGPMCTRLLPSPGTCLQKQGFNVFFFFLIFIPSSLVTLLIFPAGPEPASL